MKLIKIFGIQIKINYFLLPIIILSMVFQYISHIIIIILIVIIHELAHCVVCRYYNIRVSEIEILPFGGVAKIDHCLRIDPQKEIRIAIAGPISNIVLIIIGIIIKKIFFIESELLQFFLFLNYTIGIFNLIPVVPLDGGRIIKSYISINFSSRRGIDLMIKLGKIISITIFITGLYLIIYSIYNIYLCILALFLYIKVKKEKEILSLMFVQEIIMKEKYIYKNQIVENKNLTALESVHLIKLFQMLDTGKYHFITVINKEGKILGCISEGQLLDGMIKYGSSVTIGFLLQNIENNSPSKSY